MSRTFKILISNWPRTRKFNRLLHAGKAIAFYFLTVTRWSRSTSNFYVLIGEKLTGEFMRKIYAASGLLTEENLSGKTHNNSIAVKVTKTVGLIARLRCIILTCTLPNLRSYLLGQCFPWPNSCPSKMLTAFNIFWWNRRYLVFC